MASLEIFASAPRPVKSDFVNVNVDVKVNVHMIVNVNVNAKIKVNCRNNENIIHGWCDV